MPREGFPIVESDLLPLSLGAALLGTGGVEEAAGVKCSAIISAEIGGSNSIEPMLTAARAGLPVVDGDGMGRAFPEIQMSTFFIYGLDPSPGAIADDKGNVVVFKHVIDMFWLERFARRIAVDMGAGAGFATTPMPGAYLKKVAVPNTLTQILYIGRVILDARAKHQDVVSRLIDATGAKLLFTGKVTGVRRELRGGFAVGEAEIAGVDAYAGSSARIAIQNENLVLFVDGKPVAIVPDLIMNLQLETGEPITTETLRFGQQIATIGLPAHELMKTPRALEVVGPEAFGYPDIPFVPLS